MRPWIQWTTGISGLVITGIGLFATWKVLAPGTELTSMTLDGWMFEGPALVTFGLLLLWTASGTGKGDVSLEKRAPRLLMQIGLWFLVLPGLTWAWNAASGSAASSYAWTFATFAFGVPGLALALTGAALWLWRLIRRGDGA
jgi:hypothetical protein